MRKIQALTLATLLGACTESIPSNSSIEVSDENGPISIYRTFAEPSLDYQLEVVQPDNCDPRTHGMEGELRIFQHYDGPEYPYWVIGAIENEGESSFRNLLIYTRRFTSPDYRDTFSLSAASRDLNPQEEGGFISREDFYDCQTTPERVVCQAGESAKPGVYRYELYGYDCGCIDTESDRSLCGAFNFFFANSMDNAAGNLINNLPPLIYHSLEIRVE